MPHRGESHNVDSTPHNFSGHESPCSCEAFRITPLRAMSYYFDQGKMRSYMDDTEPLENDVDETKFKLFQLIGLIILVIGVSVILYIIFGKHKFRFFSIGGKKKCPECSVIFTKKAKWCPYCEIPLDD